MKRRSFAEAAGSDGEDDDGPPSSGSEAAATSGKRQRHCVANAAESSGFDRGPVELPQGVGSAAKQLLLSNSEVRRTVDVPPSVDRTLLQELLGPNSKFPRRLYDETGCVAILACGGTNPPLSLPLSIHITGGNVLAVEAAVVRIRGLFRLPPPAWHSLIVQFTMQDRPGTQNSESATSIRVETKCLDLSKLDAGPDRGEKLLTIPETQIPYVMTVESKQAISEATGAEIQWEPPCARLVGTGVQIAKAEKMLLRVTKHCLWGASDAKVAALLKPVREGGEKNGAAIRLRLTPMSSLTAFEATLTGAKRTIKVGKGVENDIIVPDALVSRKHCVLAFDRHRGTVYVYDVSTNGTFLNGKRLPSKKSGKVILMHGDELLLKNPIYGDGEFGYIVNVQQVY